MSDASRAMILVCDDDRLVLATLAHGLKAAGFDVIEADNGDDAILLARERRPDLALLDMRMNGKTGLDVAAYLRDHVGTPFMFLSAFNDERIVRQAVDFGALAYLVKPLDVRQIVPAVEAALARGDLAAPAGDDSPPAGEPPLAVAAMPPAPTGEPPTTAPAAGSAPAFAARPATPFAEAPMTAPAAAGASTARAPAAAAALPAEAVAVGVLMERHRLSVPAARRWLAGIAAGQGRSEAAVAADIVAAATLLSGMPAPSPRA